MVRPLGCKLDYGGIIDTKDAPIESHFLVEAHQRTEVVCIAILLHLGACSLSYFTILSF